MSFHDTILTALACTTESVSRPNTREIKEVQEILGVFDMARDDAYKRQISPNSGSWLVCEKGYASWIHASTDDNYPHVYWLFGLPGSGKTMLSNIVIDQLQRRSQTLQFHFFSEAHQAQRSVAYALRSIATQLALEDVIFCRALLTLHHDTGLVFSSENQSVHGIWEKLFEGIIFQLDSPQPLIWVFDGIDEADEPDTFLSYLSQIQSRTPIKMFLSSRPHKGISRFESARIRSYFLRQDDTAEDMKTYATKALQQTLPANEQVLHNMINQTMKNSSGSFLWVKLAIEALEDSWHTQEDIRAALNSLPGGMVPMYNRMLGKIESQTPRNLEMARRILTWTACSWRPLRIDELQVALEPEFRNFINLEDTIAQICGHFVNIAPISDRYKQVSLIHKTARDFLTKGGSDTAGNNKSPFINLQDGHRHLALVCLRYMSSDHWRRHFATIHVSTKSSVFIGKGSNRLLLAGEDYSLLCYAACYWPYHVSKAPPVGAAPKLVSTLKVFFAKYLLTWLEAIFLSGNLEYLTRAAQHLKTVANRHMKSQTSRDGTDAEDMTKCLQSWATDIARIASKFGPSLLSDPPSLYRHLPAFCPKNSMVGKTYSLLPHQVSSSLAFKVAGIELDEWDDCIASIDAAGSGSNEPQWISQILVAESNFVTLVSSNGGAITVWNAETCERLHTITVASAGFVPLMTVNMAGTAVAAVNYDSYTVWNLHSGRRLYHCVRRDGSMVLDMRFGMTERDKDRDMELLVALSNNQIVRINVQTGESNQFNIIPPKDSDFTYPGCPPYQGSPWRMTFSPDLTKIAAAWRGRPPLIWDLLPTGVSPGPRRCLVSDSTNSICGPEILRWHSNGDILYIMCQNMSVVEWRILEDTQREWNHMMAREMVISPDGNLLMTADSAGTISIWGLPRADLVYRHFNDNGLCNDMAFNPAGNRFYDIRESVCNVFEPNILLLSAAAHTFTDENENEPETKTKVSRFDAGGQQVTAIACDTTDKYYCCGREDGKIWIHDALSGKRLRKVYAHKGWSHKISVTSLVWSNSGRYMASCDNIGRNVIVKRLVVKEEGVWGVFPVFDRKLEESWNCELPTQLLFSESEEYLLLSTPKADHVWDLKAKTVVKILRWGDVEQNRRWIQHPSEKDILVWIDTKGLRCHRWPELELVGEEVPSSLSNPASESPEIPPALTAEKSPGQHKLVPWAVVTADKQFLIYATIPEKKNSFPDHPLNNPQIHLVDTRDMLKQDQPTTEQCPPGVAARIKRLLGMAKTCVVFLDHDCWVCTWNTLDKTGQVIRHFFIPTDWANTSTSHLVMVNGQGTLLCPRYGEVGIVRGGIRV